MNTAKFLLIQILFFGIFYNTSYSQKNKSVKTTIRSINLNDLFDMFKMDIDEINERMVKLKYEFRTASEACPNDAMCIHYDCSLDNCPNRIDLYYFYKRLDQVYFTTLNFSIIDQIYKELKTLNPKKIKNESDNDIIKTTYDYKLYRIDKLTTVNKYDQTQYQITITKKFY